MFASQKRIYYERLAEQLGCEGDVEFAFKGSNIRSIVKSR